MNKRRLLERALTPEEIETLEDLARQHPYGDFRLRGLGLLALDAGRTVVEICEILRISDQPIYNWAKAWREQGLMGILKGHQGGAPVKLTAQMLDVAAQIAREESLTLGKIAAKLKERFPDAPPFGLDRLSLGLKARGLSFKRTEITDRWLLQHRFVTLFLPAYSPELNLIEILWKHAKFHWRGFTSWTKDTLIPEVTNLLSSFGSKFHINYA